MRPVLTSVALVLISVPSSSSYATDPATVAAVGQFIYEAWQQGVKWQNSQSWGKFRARQFRPPVKIGNMTNQPVTYTIESENCDPDTGTLQPWATEDARCGDGDPWYNYSFNGQTYSIDAGGTLMFERDDNGNIDVYDVTERVKAQGQR